MNDNDRITIPQDGVYEFKATFNPDTIGLQIGDTFMLSGTIFGITIKAGRYRVTGKDAKGVFVEPVGLLEVFRFDY